MELDIRKLIAAGVLAGGLGLGVAAAANAQEGTDDSTTTTQAPGAAPPPAEGEAPAEEGRRGPGRAGCDWGDQDDPGGGGSLPPTSVSSPGDLF